MTSGRQKVVYAAKVLSVGLGGNCVAGHSSQIEAALGERVFSSHAHKAT